MKRGHFSILLMFLIAFLSHSAVMANSYRLHITAFDFASQATGLALNPSLSIVGDIYFEAPDLFSEISAISFVDLTIDGHVYSPAEVGAEKLGPVEGRYRFGGLITHVNGLYGGTSDFSVPTYHPIGGQFLFTTTKNIESFGTSKYEVQITSVPEPATAAMVLGGLFSLIGM